jgi:hypothetical protein
MQNLASKEHVFHRHQLDVQVPEILQTDAWAQCRTFCYGTRVLL